MKKVLFALLGIVILAGLVSPWMPVSVGQAVYAHATDLEANLYGLEQHEADIGEMNMAYYRRPAANAEATILMLHGYSANKDVWTRFASNLNEHYDIVVPDMAGHGDTPFQSNWDYSAPAQVERLIALLDALKVDKVHVVGNSMGGFIAAHFARMYPERTLSATLVDPAGVTSPEPSDMENMLAEGRNPFEVDNREEFDEFFAMTMAQPPFLPELVLKAVAQDYVERKPQLQKIFVDFHRSTDMLDGRLDQIQAPVLLMWGGKDRLIHVSSVKVWEAGIPDIRTQIWDDVGHMPMMEIPKQSAAVFQGFIDQIGRDA